MKSTTEDFSKLNTLRATKIAFLTPKRYDEHPRLLYEMITNEARGAELVIIISYSASPSRIIVLVKTHRKLLLLKGEKIKQKEKGMKKK